MDVSSLAKALPGELVQLTYVIVYQFPDGVQDKRHPNPGVPYKGTFRRAFIPGGTDEGRKVLAKFLKAWDQRVLLTVGRSMTTNIDNCVVWSGIHHKTSIYGGPTCFGFPDIDYLKRVTDELAEAGVL
jgi:deltex-like protein